MNIYAIRFIIFIFIFCLLNSQIYSLILYYLINDFDYFIYKLYFIHYLLLNIWNSIIFNYNKLSDFQISYLILYL